MYVANWSKTVRRLPASWKGESCEILAVRAPDRLLIARPGKENLDVAASDVEWLSTPTPVVTAGATFGPWADHTASCKCNVCR